MIISLDVRVNNLRREGGEEYKINESGGRRRRKNC